ncbi:unnamed protein product [Calypogeia fissa]
MNSPTSTGHRNFFQSETTRVGMGEWGGWVRRNRQAQYSTHAPGNRDIYRSEVGHLGALVVQYSVVVKGNTLYPPDYSGVTPRPLPDRSQTGSLTIG